MLNTVVREEKILQKVCLDCKAFYHVHGGVMMASNSLSYEFFFFFFFLKKRTFA